MRCTKEWVLKSDTNNQKSLIDRLLEVRGIKSEDAKREFLHPLEITLTHPNAFTDMQKAVTRITKAIDEKDKAESVSSVYIKNDDLTDILEEVRRLNNEISVVINTGYLAQGFTDIEKNQLIELVKEIEEKVIDVTSTTFDTRKELRDEARKLIRKKNGGD